jgi:hypothetical protein
MMQPVDAAEHEGRKARQRDHKAFDQNAKYGGVIELLQGAGEGGEHGVS